MQQKRLSILGGKMQRDEISGFTAEGLIGKEVIERMGEGKAEQRNYSAPDLRLKEKNAFNVEHMMKPGKEEE